MVATPVLSAFPDAGFPIQPRDASLGARRLLVCGRAGTGKTTVTNQLMRAGKGLCLVRDTPGIPVSGDASAASQRLGPITGNDRAWITVECRSGESMRRLLQAGRGARTAIWVVDPDQPLPQPGTWMRTALAALGIRDVVLCVNRMDQVGFRQSRFDRLVDRYLQVALPATAARLVAIPLVATRGCNITRSCDEMTWYQGLPLARLLSVGPSSARTYG